MNRSVCICHSKSAELFQLKGWASELLILFFVFVLFQLSKLFIQNNLSSVLWRHLLYIQNGQSQQEERSSRFSGTKSSAGVGFYDHWGGVPKRQRREQDRLNQLLSILRLLDSQK